MFAIVALVSAMFLIQQHGLKKKQFKGVYQYLPSVQQLDLMAKRLLITGVLVLSAALIFGAVFWVNHPERVPVFKLSATCLVWAGYLTVVVLRIQKTTRHPAPRDRVHRPLHLRTRLPLASAICTRHRSQPTSPEQFRDI